MLLKRILSALLSLLFLISQTPVAAAMNLGDVEDDFKEVQEQLAAFAKHEFSELVVIESELISGVGLLKPPLERAYHTMKSELTWAEEHTRKLYASATESFDQANLLDIVIGGASAYDSVSRSLTTVPSDFQQLLAEMPRVAMRVKYRAGRRAGEPFRSSADAYRLFQKVPGSALLDASEDKVLNFLRDKDASHIISDKHGGTSHVDNLFWENRFTNRQRGALNTTQLDLLKSRLFNGTEGIVQNSKTITELGFSSVGLAVLVDALVEAEVQAVDLYNGNISLDEFLHNIEESAVKSAMSAAAFYTLMVIAIALCPELTPVLASNALVVASQVMLGSRLALPLLKLMPAL